MAQTEKSRDHRFYIINIKLRKSLSNKDPRPSDYTNLIERLFQKKIHAQSSSQKHCILKNLFYEKGTEDKILYLSGIMAQFTYIENERWFDLATLDLDEEFKIPETLFPDAKFTEWVFVPDAHRFAFRVDYKANLNPYPIATFLKNAIEEILEDDEYIEVTPETDKITIEKILNAPIVKKLSIQVTYSNFDIGDDIQQFVDDDFRESNLKDVKIVATQKKDTSIDIEKSKILKGALQSAASNGEAEATIIDENNKIEKIRTQDYPLKARVHGTLSRFNDLVFDKIMSLFR